VHCCSALLDAPNQARFHGDPECQLVLELIAGGWLTEHHTATLYGSERNHGKVLRCKELRTELRFVHNCYWRGGCQFSDLPASVACASYLAGFSAAMKMCRAGSGLYAGSYMDSIVWLRLHITRGHQGREKAPDYQNVSQCVLSQVVEMQSSLPDQHV
jgi:hypothetical protein